MAAVAYNIVLNAETIREDLGDLIDIMTPADLPYHALYEEETITDVYKEWSQDEFANPTTPASDVEGSAPSFSSKVPEPVRATAGVCIVKKEVEVSDTHRVTLQAGMEDAYNYLMWKQAVAAMKQMEINLHYQAGGTAKHATEDTARPCSGLWWWLTEAFNGQTVVGMDFGSAAKFEPYKPKGFLTATTPADILRKELHDNIIEPGWNSGMNINGAVLLCGSKIKRIISEFALVYADGNAVQRRNIGADQKKLIETIDFFETDFGTIAMNLDRYMSTTVSETWAGEAGVRRDSLLILLEPDKVKRLVLRGLSHVPIAKTTDGTRGMVVVEEGIKISNTLAGVIGINMAAD